MSKTKTTFLTIGVIAAIIAIVFATGGLNLAYKAVFKPAHQAVERKVFINTPSYVRGAAQDLARYKLQYETGEPAEQLAIRDTIRDQYADLDADALESDRLRSFLIRMRGY